MTEVTGKETFFKAALVSHMTTQVVLTVVRFSTHLTFKTAKFWNGTLLVSLVSAKNYRSAIGIENTF